MLSLSITSHLFVSLCLWTFFTCYSCFLSLAVIKHSSHKQLRVGKGLFYLPRTSGHSLSLRDDRAGEFSQDRNLKQEL